MRLTQSHVIVPILNMPAFPGIDMAKFTLVKYITVIQVI